MITGQILTHSMSILTGNMQCRSRLLCFANSRKTPPAKLSSSGLISRPRTVGRCHFSASCFEDFRHQLRLRSVEAPSDCFKIEAAKRLYRRLGPTIAAGQKCAFVRDSPPSFAPELQNSAAFALSFMSFEFRFESLSHRFESLSHTLVLVNCASPGGRAYFSGTLCGCCLRFRFAFCERESWYFCNLAGPFFAAASSAAALSGL